MSRYKALYNWIANYPQLYSWLYFNVTNYDAGCVSLNTVSMSRYLSKDILGNKTVEMVCAIDMIKEYDTGTSDVNIDAIAEVDNFTKWIEQQTEYPTLADNITVDKIEVVSNAPSLSVDNENNLAKYQFQFKITYTERKI